MKLRELKLKNFGKFHDKSIQLQDGINVICGENESGKTTMHTFIKAMLFGNYNPDIMDFFSAIHSVVTFIQIL